jgi:hypothetical protein
MYKIIKSLKEAVEIIREQKHNFVMSGLHGEAHLLFDKEKELLLFIEKFEESLYLIEG